MQTDIYDRFLRACLSGDREHMTHERDENMLRNPGWSWEHLFQRATEQAVLPALHGAIRDAGIEALAPAEVTDFLAGVEALNRERNAAIFDDLRAAVTLLNRVGIRPVLLKGCAYILTGVYCDAGTRYLGDIDLLVGSEEIESAAEVLMANGFEQDDSDIFGRLRHHHPPLRRPGGISIEIHHTLILGGCTRLLPADEVIACATPFTLDSLQVQLPSPEHMLTHLVLHSQLQHPYNERIWPPLRAIYDLVQLNRRLAGLIDWSRIEHRFRRAGQYGLLVLHAMDAHDALGFEPPFKVGITPSTRLRRWRRQLLRRFPRLRYADPIYMFSTVLTRRLRVLRSALNTPAGWKYVVAQLLDGRIYRRLFTDVIEGIGR